MPARPTLEAWRTAITLIEPDVIRYRGVPIAEAIDSWSFPATVWLLLTGTTPDPGQEDAVRRVLVSACDHGLAAPSIAAARTVASTRGSPGVGMAAGLLAFAGPAHGGAAGKCARALEELRAMASAWPVPDDEVERVVMSRLESGPRMPGFGHPYHDRDPRVQGLMAAAVEDDGYRRLVRSVEAVLVREKGPRLHMNADAAVAAVLLDARLPEGAIDLITSIGRCVGLAAHVHEENSNEAPFRAPSLASIEYIGPLDGGA
ncbi:MAG: citrate/2-methylcitrate synthase [Thermoleophilaceae bacterium]